MQRNRFPHATAAVSLTLVLTLSPLAVRAQAPGDVDYKRSGEFEKPAPPGAIAPRLQNLGGHTFAVSTLSAQAQLFINQGVNLAYGFNHQEAGRAFREAARLDPDCAMAYWGQALVLGPNINMPMTANDEPKAHELAQRAVSLKGKASVREQAYIDALAQRYSGNAADREERDRAYANAMRGLHKRFPDDLDAATLFAEALMDLRPWNYWTPEYKPYAETAEAVAAIEGVLQRNPNHPGANHYYIHLMELPYPERAEKAADRLGKLMPGAGHIVHMPAHIYQRIGRYADASAANERAILADEDYITQCRVQGMYPVSYYPHNVHFLWSAATMEGRSQVAIEAARRTAATVPAQALEEAPMLEGFLVVPYYALTRFGKWKEMLAEPKPAHGSSFVTGVWHYARGMAHAGLGEFEQASSELQRLRAITASPDLAKVATWSTNSARGILSVAVEALAGEILARRHEYDQAIAHLDKAVRLQDALDYAEPPDWHYPMRHSLGAVLLQAGRPKEAEVVYWEDLRQNPENGWALYGLMQAMQAQQKQEQARETRERFQKAWTRADVTLSSSRF